MDTVVAIITTSWATAWYQGFFRLPICCGKKKKVTQSLGAVFKQAQQVINLNAAVYGILHKCLNNIQIDPRSFSS